MAGLMFLKTLFLASMGITRRRRSSDPVTPEVPGLILDFANETLQSKTNSQEVSSPCGADGFSYLRDVHLR